MQKSKTNQRVVDAIVGRKIVEVVVDVENDNEVTLVLDNGTAVAVMCDPEGNHPGSLHVLASSGKFLGTVGWM